MSIKESIKKLLESKEISNYKISKATGIAQTTLSDYASEKSKIGNMKLDHALKLYEFYLEYKDEV
ncbi:HTH domain-containing protein [Lederbergia galactosidilytica]|uniref:HTH domain-containing protein n=1 Tax=Lederbergia galactosidilytica TaxID=217031 RepID=UPI0007DB3C38|nr:HTH domain-containing protein [Lederbergia galactosidilytica]